MYLRRLGAKSLFAQNRQVLRKALGDYNGAFATTGADRAAHAGGLILINYGNMVMGRTDKAAAYQSAERAKFIEGMKNISDDLHIYI